MRTDRYKLFGLILLAILAITLGSARTAYWHYHYGDGDLHHLIGQSVTITGYISDEPDVRDYNTRLTVQVDESRSQILVIVPHYPQWQYGQAIEITGTIETPENFITESGRVFDYQNYLRKDRIFYLSRFAQVSHLEVEPPSPSALHAEASRFKSWLFRIKHSFLHQLELQLPEPHSSLMGGLLVGAKASMGQDLLDDFRTTGLIHIVVLSGFNITIIVDAIMRILTFLGTTVSFVFGSFAILAFALMTGGSATVLRASIMAFLVLLARVTGRQREVMRMLLWAGIAMLVVNPMLLLYDPSFQLSFLATLGLIWLTPLMERYIGWIPKKPFDIKGLLAATVATQIMVMPMLLWMSGELPVYALVVNLLVLVMVPFAMAVGFAAGLVSYLGLGLALGASLCAYGLLEYILRVVDVFAGLPYAKILVPGFSLQMMLGMYGLYAVVFAGVWWWKGGWEEYDREVLSER